MCCQQDGIESKMNKVCGIFNVIIVCEKEMNHNARLQVLLPQEITLFFVISDLIPKFYVHKNWAKYIRYDDVSKDGVEVSIQNQIL